ncbi:MAG: TRIC cation channel family protein [Chthoniobacter sp.]|nr:TRIC cation channel family protein [Chthoniobacter sp.]
MPSDVIALPLYMDFGATFMFSITGAMFAIRRHYDWVGLFALALCSGLGGGLLRDGLFIQDGAPAAMRHAGYLWAVLGGCLAAGLFHQLVGKFDQVFLYVDALGLGAYSVVGATKAYGGGLALPAVIVIGVVNAVGGSLIRDVLVSAEPHIFKPGQFYVVAALTGTCTYVVLTAALHLPLQVSAWIAIAVTFAARMLSIYFNWRTDSILPPPEAVNPNRD